jgi:hypothetical protein
VVTAHLHAMHYMTQNVEESLAILILLNRLDVP